MPNKLAMTNASSKRAWWVPIGSPPNLHGVVVDKNLHQLFVLHHVLSTRQSTALALQHGCVLTPELVR